MNFLGGHKDEPLSPFKGEGWDEGWCTDGTQKPSLT